MGVGLIISVVNKTISRGKRRGVPTRKQLEAEVRAFFANAPADRKERREYQKATARSWSRDEIVAPEWKT